MHYSIAVVVALMGLLQASANPFTVVRRVPDSSGIATIPGGTTIVTTISPSTTGVEPGPSGSGFVEELAVVPTVSVSVSASASTSISISTGAPSSSSAPSGGNGVLPLPISVSLSLSLLETAATPVPGIAEGKLDPRPVPLSVVTPA